MKYISLIFLNVITVISLFILEFGLRLYFDMPTNRFPNFTASKVDPGNREDVRMNYESEDAKSTNGEKTFNNIYDEVLGWVHPTVEDAPRGLYSFPVSGDPRYLKGHVLVIGDSMTQGPPMDINQSWPAQLSRNLALQAVNAAVGGYGIDQMFLRLKKLLETSSPKIVIFAYIPDNMHRAELSVFHSFPKPFYDVRDGKLVLKNVPVPRYEPSYEQVGLFRLLLGYSFFVDRLAVSLGLADKWYMGSGELRVEHQQGAEVGCIIVNKLRELEIKKNLRVILYPLYSFHDVYGKTYPESFRKHQAMARCAKKKNIKVADPLPSLFQYKADNNLSDEDFFGSFWGYPSDGHFNLNGYKFTADFVTPFVRGLSAGR